MEYYLSVSLYFATKIAALYSAIILFLRTFKHLRSHGNFEFLKPADRLVSRLYDAILFQNHYPGDGFPSYIPDLNEHKAFYKEFSRRIKCAKRVIYNSGDGFYMRAEMDVGAISNSGDKADLLDSDIIYALQRSEDLTYHRFQITATCSLGWISRMIYMKNKFGHRYQIYTNRYFDHIGQFSAIDPHDKDCVFQWQLVGGRYYLRGVMSKGYGFIYKNNKICHVVEAIFKEIMMHPATNYLTEDGVSAALTVARLRMLQKQIWEERTSCIKTDYRVDLEDPEIIEILDNREKDGITDQPRSLEFLESDFPMIPVPMPHKRKRVSASSSRRSA